MKCVIRGRYRKRTSLFNLYFSFRKLSVLAISSNKMTWKPFCSYLNEIGSNQVDWHGACSMFIISYLYLVIYWGPQALLVTVYTVECLYTNFQKKLSEPRAIFTGDKRYENDHWFRPRSRISRMTVISYDHFKEVSVDISSFSCSGQNVPFWIIPRIIRVYISIDIPFHLGINQLSFLAS